MYYTCIAESIKVVKCFFYRYLPSDNEETTYLSHGNMAELITQQYFPSTKHPPPHTITGHSVGVGHHGDCTADYSFATRDYLERHHLVKRDEKILDIEKLKELPKLL